MKLSHPGLTEFKITRGDLLGPDMYHDVQEIAEAFRQNNGLRRLYLNDLSKDTAITFLDAIRQHHTIEELSFSRCRLKGELTEILPLHIQRLALNGTSIDPEHAENIARCIRSHWALFDLRLSWTNMGVHGARVIGDSLAGASLTSLCLVRCRIGDSGAVALSQGLSNNTGIQELWLEENEIGPAGATALARAVERHPAIREIWFYKNRIGNGGASAFGRCLGLNSSIQKLNLDGNKIDAESVVALADGLSRNKTLLHLWLFHNSVRDRGALAMRDAMRTNTTLRRMDGIMSTNVNSRNIREEIYFCLDLNRKGWRKALLSDEFPSALWAFVLGVRFRNQPAAIYFFLRDKPDLISGAYLHVDL